MKRKNRKASQPDRDLITLRAGVEPSSDGTTFRVTVSTADPVYCERIGDDLILEHREGSITFPADVPATVGHDMRGRPVGRASGWELVEGDRLDAVLRLGRSDESRSIAQDMDDGIITDVSITARMDWSAVDTSVSPAVARSWAPVELGIVAIGADARAKVHRASIPEGDELGDDVRHVEALFVGLDGERFATMRADCLAGVVTGRMDLGQARARVDAALEVRRSAGTGGTVHVGRDAVDGFLAAAELALEVRSGVHQFGCVGHGRLSIMPPRIDAAKREAEARQCEYLSYSLLDLSREWLRINGIETRGLSKNQIARMALEGRASSAMLGITPGDLTSTLAATVNKAVAGAYVEAEETWRIWCKIGNLADFKQGSRPILSRVPTATEIPTTGEYRRLSVEDKHENLQLRTYGGIIDLTRKAIVNDDLSVLSSIPQALGQATARAIGDDAYGVLTTNAALNEDAVALFHTASHANLAGSGAAPSIATLGARRTAMATQTDGHSDNPTVLNIRARYLLAPIALEDTCSTLIAAAHVPTTTGAAVPPWMQGLTLVTDARLDSNSATAWYMLASSMSVPTVEVAFLDGISTPTVSQESHFERDGVSIKASIDFDSGAMDYRGMQKDPG